MATSALETAPQDDLTRNVARVLAAANAVATAEGVDLATRLLTITEESPPPDRVWRVHYGPRDFVRRRGGDLFVLVQESTGQICRIFRGQ
jgi:hypothetical protein